MRVLTTISLALVSLAADELPLAGSYMENTPCRADTPPDARVSITATEIKSPMGSCKILYFKREEDTFTINVDCNGPAENQLVANVRFTLRPDQSLDFADQDQSYRSVLYRCP